MTSNIKAEPFVSAFFNPKPTPYQTEHHQKREFYSEHMEFASQMVLE
jgi:hypothetical protein